MILIKRKFREKCQFKTIVCYSLEDGKNNKWFSLPAFDLSIKEAASLIDPKSFKHNQISINCSLYWYKNKTDNKKTSSCSGICSHVVAYSYTNALDWYGSQYRQPENFVPNTKS